MLGNGPVVLKRLYFEMFGILTEKKDLEKIEKFLASEAEKKMKLAMEQKDLNFLVETISKIYINPNCLSNNTNKEFKNLIKKEAISENFIKNYKKEIMELLGKTGEEKYKLTKKQKETWQLWNLMQFFKKISGPRNYRDRNIRQEFLNCDSFNRITNSWDELKKNITAEKVKQTKWLEPDLDIIYKERNDFINLLKKEIERNREIVDLCRKSDGKIEKMEQKLKNLGLRKSVDYSTKELYYQEYYNSNFYTELIKTERKKILSNRTINNNAIKEIKKLENYELELLKLESDKYNEELIKNFKIDFELYILTKRRF